MNRGSQDRLRANLMDGSASGREGLGVRLIQVSNTVRFVHPLDRLSFHPFCLVFLQTYRAMLNFAGVRLLSVLALLIVLFCSNGQSAQAQDLPVWAAPTSEKGFQSGTAHDERISKDGYSTSSDRPFGEYPPPPISHMGKPDCSVDPSFPACRNCGGPNPPDFCNGYEDPSQVPIDDWLPLLAAVGLAFGALTLRTRSLRLQ